jgi:hypothetical protein
MAKVSADIPPSFRKFPVSLSGGKSGRGRAAILFNRSID